MIDEQSAREKRRGILLRLFSDEACVACRAARLLPRRRRARAREAVATRTLRPTLGLQRLCKLMPLFRAARRRSVDLSMQRGSGRARPQRCGVGWLNYAPDVCQDVKMLHNRGFLKPDLG
jgi:hypothetical protein